MPRKPRKTLRPKRELSPEEQTYLTNDKNEKGFTIFCYRHGNRGFDGAIHPRDLWALYRDELLPKFIAEHPGCRPLPWWQWDAPDGWRENGSFEDNYMAKLRAEIRGEWPQEKQARFLARHGLLTTVEMKSLAKRPKVGETEVINYG
jgi:hypothetical protein